jgi:hypothetical protein
MGRNLGRVYLVSRLGELGIAAPSETDCEHGLVSNPARVAGDDTVGLNSLLHWVSLFLSSIRPGPSDASISDLCP